MLDIKRIRNNEQEIIRLLNKRHGQFPIEELLHKDRERRELIKVVEEKKYHVNQENQNIPILKKNGEDLEPVFKRLKELSLEIKTYDEKIKGLDEEIETLLLQIPNTPDEKVPDGVDDADNVEIRKWGEPRHFDFDPLAHWDIGKNLDILDFDRATKISGPRFTVFKGLGARLERAIYSFMLDVHTQEHGYTEMGVPVLMNRAAMTGTGQLPKFENDMFHCEKDDYFLAPTAEVPLTNLLHGEIVSCDQLPIYYTAYTPCFRRESGSAGRDTRGLIRNHQFDKVEMVKFTAAENSFDELESLTDNAEDILRKLGLPYRVVRLCSGDLGFSSTMTYDIEVWMPSYNAYVEISSCSNFLDYQARRANLRYRDENGKVQYLHTLNGSGLAVGRTLAAVLENGQQEDGSVVIPEVLVPYMGIRKID